MGEFLGGRFKEDFGRDGGEVLLEEGMEGGSWVKGWEDNGVRDLADVVVADWGVETIDAWSYSEEDNQ